jgi:hypothetical protein
VDGRVDPVLLVTGFQRAANRFMGGGDRLRWLIQRELLHHEEPERFSSPFDDEISPHGLFCALFEALSWAATIDKRFRLDWPVAGGDPRSWFLEFENGGAVRGLRYARNCVHHDWTQAIVLPAEHHGTPVRMTAISWEWLPCLASRIPDPGGAAAYGEHLAGEKVAVSLQALNVVFVQGFALLRRHGLSDPQAPVLGLSPPSRTA